MANLVRTGLSLEQDLLEQFDEFIARRGYQNRSEAVRDLIREHLVSEEGDQNKEYLRYRKCLRHLFVSAHENAPDRECPRSGRDWSVIRATEINGASLRFTLYRGNRTKDLCSTVKHFCSPHSGVKDQEKIRILVVDDHALVRRTICSLLSHEPTLDVICQTADGEEAVTKAVHLQPDLVLLDIGLPGISGIEAARRIRKVSPKSQIIFLSQHDSLEMVNEALKVGGHGYVAKIDAGSELLKAIRTVSEGSRFVSQRIVDQGWIPPA